MHHRYRYGVALAVSVLSVALAFSMTAGAATKTTSKASPQASTGTPHRGGSVTDLVNLGQWPGLDPATNTQDTADATENNAIFGQLFYLGADNSVNPDMATGYKYFDHNLQVDIYLRPGQKFTDGSKFTAAVAAWNIERDLLPANGCLCITNYANVTSVSTKGAYTLVLNLKTPTATIIPAFINEAPNWIASEQSETAMGEAAFAQHPIGAGPFEVVSNEASAKLVLQRNPGYWDKPRPYINNLTFQVGGSDQTDLDAIQTGQGNYSIISTLSLVSSVKPAGLKLFKGPDNVVEFVALNSKITPFNNLTARQALQYATNPKQLIQSLYFNLYTPVESFTAPGMLFYQKNVPGFAAYDPTKAQSMWSSIGAPAFTVDTTSNTLFWVQETNALAQQWAAAGIHAAVTIDTLQNLLQKLGSNNWQACTANWGSFDPGIALPIYFSAQGQFSGTVDPTLDGLLNQGTQFVNSATRGKIYSEIDERLTSQAEAVFEYAKPTLFVTSKNLEGIDTATDNLVQWQYVYVK